ncbi:MAG: ABC transporter substrate-binding protein [Phycisphaeraceae bacterium]|nr:ABC transporter substrate-binding protein [Phycisphaeraceae bacterium]
MVIQKLTLAHSPDPDDAFMWWPIFEGLVIEPGMVFEPVIADIETLNRRAAGDSSQLLDVTAMSCANVPLVRERYLVTACGASVGEGYGPKLVARSPITLDALKSSRPRIATPGARTTAALTLALLIGRDSYEPVEVDFQEIEGRVASGEFDAGVVIHESQLTYADRGLHLVEDLGRWWMARSGLPLPLGVNAVRRDLDDRLGPGSLAKVVDLLHRSVRYAMEHRDEGVGRSLAFARGLDAATAGRFVDLYVNRWTLNMGERGRSAVARLIEEATAAGLLPAGSTVDFAPLHSATSV